MLNNPKKKMVLIGISGTANDFLLSLHVLKSFLYQSSNIKDHLEVALRQYYYISPENIKQSSEEIFNDIEKIKPVFVGFSCYVWNIDVVRIILDKLKEKYKNIKVILGGPEITSEGMVSEKYKNFNANFLIFGEGEKPLLALIEHLLRLNRRKIKDIKSLGYRRNGLFFCNNQPDFIEDLDKAPSAYLDGYIPDDILLRPGIRVNIETQRGCSFRCAYCFYHKNFPKIRYRNADMVIDEIEYVYKKGIKIGRILDANFLSDRLFAKKILMGLIQHKIKMSLFFEILPQFLNEEIAQVFGEYMKLSTENRITIGIGLQTINQEALVTIKRKIPQFHFERAFGLLQKYRVIIKSDIILGLPRETKESYLETMEFITEKMRYGTNYLSLALLRVLPGSDLVEIAKREKLIIDKRDSSHSVYATLTLPRNEMLECLRLNTVAFRLLSSIDEEKRMRLRDMYFTVKDTLEVRNVELLQYLTRVFFDFLKDSGVDYVKPDFPNAEYYSCRNIYNDISDEWLMEKLSSLKKLGYLNFKKVFSSYELVS